MGFYSFAVAFSYEYSTITVGVDAVDDDDAIEVAESLVAQEWGQGAREWSAVDVELIG